MFGAITISWLLCNLLSLLMILVLLRVVLSWFPPSGGVFDAVQQLVFQATEWLFAPLRRVLPPVRLGAAMLDLTPVVVLLGLSVLRNAIC
ncbi:MAG: YggT family protein [Actinomycetes bacterium]